MSGVHDLNLENYVTGLNIETTWPIWCMSAGNYDRSSDNFEVNKMCNSPGNSPGAAAPALETSPQNECGQRAKRTG